MFRKNLILKFEKKNHIIDISFDCSWCKKNKYVGINKIRIKRLTGLHFEKQCLTLLNMKNKIIIISKLALQLNALFSQSNSNIKVYKKIL